VDKGANVEHADNYGKTGIIYAVKRCWVSAVQILMEARANIDHEDQDGQTAVSYAAESAFPLNIDNRTAIP
jgi:ankyrin repeat protein